MCANKLSFWLFYNFFHTNFNWWYFTCDSKSAQASRTLLSILVDLNTAVVWLILILPLISDSTCVLSKLLGPVSSGQLVIVTFMFHSTFFSSPAKSKYLSMFTFSFIFTLWPAGTTESTKEWLFLFVLINTKSRLLTRVSCSVSVSKSQRILWVSFSWTYTLCIYNLLEWSNFNLLHSSQWITFPPQSCIVLFSSCASLLDSFLIWVNVSSMSALNFRLFFYSLAYYQFFLWYKRFLWNNFVLLLKEIF